MTLEKMSLQLLQEIVRDKSYKEVAWDDLEILTKEEAKIPECEGMIIDMQTANMLLTVYNALNKEHQAKFETMLTTWRGFEKLVGFGWKQVK